MGSGSLDPYILEVFHWFEVIIRFTLLLLYLRENNTPYKGAQ
jgi:hypothetical protein